MVLLMASILISKVLEHRVAVIRRKADQSCRSVDELKADIRDEQSVMLVKL